MRKASSCAGRGLGYLTVTGLSLACLAVGWRVWLVWSQQPAIFTRVEEVPVRKVAIVLGAGIRGDWPTPALADRIETAAALYHAGKVSKLLMTGDNSTLNYNEPGVMKSYAQRLNVPAEDIVLDYAGRRTYDSCYRAHAIFGIDQAVVVTQAFHLPRAVYLCDHLGVQAVGMVAQGHYFSPATRLTWETREILASAAAWWDVNVARPVPILGEPLPIGD